MKRKLLSILLTLCLAFSLLPTAALADEGKVAKIGDTGYATLVEAINAAKDGATVQLIANTNENVTISKKLTLDLNGFTLNGGTEKGKPALTVTNSVTVKDSSVPSTGTIMREDTAENSGVSSHYVIDIQGKNGFLKFEGGNVKNNSGNETRTKGASLIRLGDDSASAWPTLTINGGTFTQDNFIAIKVDRGTLHLQGGEVNSANSYAVENWNNAYIKQNAVVNGTVSTWVYSTGAAFSKLTISGGKINGNVASVNYDNATDKQARIYITGGEVTGTLGTYTYANGLVPTDVTAMATVEVTGGTFNSDPTKYVVESSTITSNGDGTYGVAKTYLAKVGETSYYTMDEAFHAAVANGETLTLLRDYTTNAVQNSGSKSFTIDLNGFTWTYTGTDTDCAAFEINYSDVTLTVKNGTVVSNSMLGLIPSAMSGTITYNNSGLVFEDVEATANGHSGIETNGNNTNDTVTLKDSTLNVPNGYGIYFPSSGTLTIDNSTINAKTMGVQVCAGSLSITGDQTAITVTGDGASKTEGDGAIEDGAAISIVNRTGYKGLGDITVTDGTFKSNGTNDAIKAYDYANAAETDFTVSGKVSVAGGTFSSAVPENLCDAKFTPTQNADGTYGVKANEGYVAKLLDAQGAYVDAYGTLAEAITAARAGQTVTLLKNVKITDQLNIDKAITLDGGDYTITRESGGSVPAEKAGILVTARATIQNLTVSGPNTTASGWDSGEFGIKFYQANNAKLINSKVTGANAGVQINGGSVTMSGTIDLSGNEFGGIEVCHNGNLDISAATLKSDNEAYNCPILWNDDTKGAIRQNAAQPLSMRASGEGKDHYYIDANKTILSQLTTDIGEKSFVVGVPTEFTFTTKANGDAGKLVVGTSNFSNTAAIEKLEYYEVQDGKWYTLSGDFGPAEGFPMSDATSKFRVTFKTAGTYSFEASMKLAGTDMVLCSTSVSFTVSNPSSSSSGSSGYYVSTPGKTENGTVTVSPRYADKGDTVTITVKPDSGYVLDDLTVTDKNGNELKLTDKGDGKYTFTMPSGRVEVKASFAKEVETSPFADVATDAYYYEAVKWAVKNGITTGVGDNLFAPGQPCTRAQIVTFLWRAAGSPEPKGTAAGMTDVVSGSYYEKAVAWAIENGVTTGTTATTFSPDATCTRAQAVTFLARALNAKAASAAEFSDVPTDSYFADAVAWAASNGVTEGVGNGLFAPDNDCTRGQIVTFLYRAYNK